jgi:hypothetical protein
MYEKKDRLGNVVSCCRYGKYYLRPLPEKAESTSKQMMELLSQKQTKLLFKFCKVKIMTNFPDDSEI